jgi:hypothetical protein
VDPSLQPVEVESLPGMGCVVPQPHAAVGNRSYLGVLGRNQRPVVPGVFYPDRFETRTATDKLNTWPSYESLLIYGLTAVQDEPLLIWHIL